MLKKVFVWLTGLFAVAALASCSEQLEAGASCPLLCPQQSAALQDTTLFPVAFDTTVNGLPSIGAENALMLASHGDTLETRAIVRYDTLPQSFTGGQSTDSIITHIDTATLVIPILKIDSLHRPTSPITIEAYDVDSIPPDSVTIPTDTVSSVIATLFRPGRLIGSKTFAPESLLDSLRIPISTDTVLDRVLKGTHLRVGLRMVTRAGQGFDLGLGTSQASVPITLNIRASLDTAAQVVQVTPLSSTPKNQDFLSGPLADYSIVIRGNTVTPAPLIGVGGVPSRRTLLRFNLPSNIIDSTTVVRATLIMTQNPNRRVSPKDSFYVFPAAILAQSVVTDIRSLLNFVGFKGEFGLDSLRMAPGDSGTREFQIVTLVRTWRGTSSAVSPRSIALRSDAESTKPGEIDFFSSKSAIAALRPRLRITYVPQKTFGLPSP